MSYEVVVAPEAAIQLETAIEWLIGIDDLQSAQRLRAAFADLLEVLRSNPYQYRPIDGTRKRIRIAKLLWLQAACIVNEDARLASVVSVRHERNDPQAIAADIARAVQSGK